VLNFAMDAGLSSKPPSTGPVRKTSSRAKSVVSEGREKTLTEAWSDGEGPDVEEVRKQDAAPVAPRKKYIRSEKKIVSVEDVDAEIARLKAPPRVLTREDFQREYDLPHEGDNPHRFRKNTVRPEALKNLFGARYGDVGRAGFCWLNCKVPEVFARVKFLHPILYQHAPGEIPNNVKVKFAEGVTFEYEEGAGFVDWCAFGAETNERQRSRYKQDLAKLLALRKTFEGKIVVDVRGKEWRAIKLEPGVAGAPTASAALGKSVKSVGLEPANTKSCLGETGDCDGNFESGMGSGVCVQGSVRDHSEGLVGWRKKQVLERLCELEGLIGVVHLELKAFVLKRVSCLERVDVARSKCKQTKCLVDSCKHQIQQKTIRIKMLEDEGASSDREKIKMEGIQEQLEEEEAQMVTDEDALHLAEVELQSVEAVLEGRQKQFNALAAENFQLKRGNSNASFWPRPMVYSQDVSTSPLGFIDDCRSIAIGVCCLCLFPFPQNDIVVSSCRHLYHPFCASVVFANSCKCLAKGCGEVPHPEWYNSFGWGEADAEMRDRSSMLGIAEERSRILHARADHAKALLPANGELKVASFFFSFLLKFVGLCLGFRVAFL
jgi:hypothetical protein